MKCLFKSFAQFSTRCLQFRPNWKEFLIQVLCWIHMLCHPSPAQCTFSEWLSQSLILLVEV